MNPNATEQDGINFWRALEDKNKRYQRQPLQEKDLEFFGLKKKPQQKAEDGGAVVEWADF